MKVQKFWKIKGEICKIFNGDPGELKLPHDECPFWKEMQDHGYGNVESCAHYIMCNPERAEEIAKEWKVTLRELKKNPKKGKKKVKNGDVVIAAMERLFPGNNVELGNDNVVTVDDQPAVTIGKSWGSQTFDSEK